MKVSIEEKERHKVALLCAEYIVNDQSEAESYEDYCQEHGLNPNDYTQKKNLQHIFACAIVALGYEHEEVIHEN